MTNKEIFAELKVCYEYINDIMENHEDRFDNEEENTLYKIREQIDDLYFNLWNKSVLEEDMSIPKKYQNDENETVLIGASASADYTIQNNRSGEFDEHLITCGGLGYYWYYDVLGHKHSDYEYEQLANGFMKALDEIKELSKKVGKDFDYYDKTRELTELSNFGALDLLDEFGSDNEEE